MNVEGRLYLERGAWVVDADPYVMGFFGRLFPKSAVVYATGTHTSRPRAIRHSPLAARELAWLLQRFGLDMSAEDRRVLQGAVADYDAHLGAVRTVKAGEYKRVELAIPLRDYQQEAVALVAAAKRLLVADDLGLGKTASAIGTTALPDALPAVVVPPTHLCAQWKREIERFMPTAQVAVLGGRAELAKGLPAATHYVVPYSRLTVWSDELVSLRPGTVVFDEIQELRHPDTKKYEAAYRVSETSRQAVGLSATPIVNYGDEIHTVLEIIRPGGLGSREEFMREWCRGGGVVHEPTTLRAFLTRNGYMIRRRRTDVGRELDPVNPVVLTVDADLAELRWPPRTRRSDAASQRRLRDRQRWRGSADDADPRVETRPARRDRRRRRYGRERRRGRRRDRSDPGRGRGLPEAAGCGDVLIHQGDGARSRDRRFCAQAAASDEQRGRHASCPREGLGALAKTRGHAFEAEARLSPESRIDFLVGGASGVGIECKVKGARPEVYRQVARYLEHDIAAVVLVCPWPLGDFVIDGKPVLVVSTAEQGLL